MKDRTEQLQAEPATTMHELALAIVRHADARRIADELRRLAAYAAQTGNGPSECFMAELIRAVHVVAGYDFHFGKARGGNAALLSYMGEMEGFGVSIVPEATLDGHTISSTRIRELLGKGDPKGAARLLGHWWTVETHVRTGDQRGRTIGFPTANLALEDHVQPAFGVYAVRIEFEDGPHKGIYDGVANLGRRPTFDKEDVLLEVHIFDFAGDVYGHHAAVSFIDFLRPEQKFAGLDALKAQIAKDGEKARAILSATPARFA